MLAEGVCAVLGRSRFPGVRDTREDGGSDGGGGGGGGGAMRILSVDMGIRNLAACLLEVPMQPGRERGGGEAEHRYKQRDGCMMVPSVIAWQRMRIPPSPATATTTTTDTTTTTTNNSDNGNDNNTACSESILGEPPAPPASAPPIPPAESFSTSTFSHHAYNLAITLLRLSGPDSPPHQILIETQRYRSAGGAAVQEWTLRVNMLESMLWGCLRTLAEVGIWGGDGRAKESCSEEEEAEQGGELIEGVNPLKVAGFWEGWLAGNGVVEVEKLQTPYWESKKSKTRIVKGLLCPPYTCTQSLASDDQGGKPLFELGTNQARETAGLFLEINVDGSGNGVESVKKVRKPVVGGGKRSKKQPKGKLDDLADCLLQGLAWVKWEEGRRRMVSGEGVFAGVDIAKLVEKGRRLEEEGGEEEVQEVVNKVRGRRKVVEEEVGRALETKVEEGVEVAVKRKRRAGARAKKVDIQENNEVTSQEITPQEIGAVSGKGELEAEDTPPALMPIVAHAKKPRKSHAKKAPLLEIIYIPPLSSETGVGEGTIAAQDSEGITPQDAAVVSGKEEVGTELELAVEAEVKVTPHTPIQIVERALPPTKRTRKPQEILVPGLQIQAFSAIYQSTGYSVTSICPTLLK